MPIPIENRKYTYQDYCSWPDEERWELIDGQPYNMPPAPTFEHQRIVGNLYRIISNTLQGKPCVPGLVPTDVVLSETDVVQPDVFVVCDEQKINKKNIQGAPDLIIDVLSPRTAKKDRWTKKRLYEKFGVRELLLVDTDGRYVEQYTLTDEGVYHQGNVYDDKDTFYLTSLTNVTILLPDIFDFEIMEGR